MLPLIFISAHQCEILFVNRISKLLLLTHLVFTMICLDCRLQKDYCISVYLTYSPWLSFQQQHPIKPRPKKKLCQIKTGSNKYIELEDTTQQLYRKGNTGEYCELQN